MTAATQNGKPPTTARDAAAYLTAHGLAVLPLPPRSKIPVLTDWPNFRLAPKDFDAHFPLGADVNVGVLTGGPSGHVVDVDLDSVEAIAVADALLLTTGRIFGRPGKPRSHRLYRTTGAAAQTRQYRDTTGEMLVELRADGCQTMFPPSIHPTGERVEWERFEGAGECATDDLQAAVARVAAAAILARHWPVKGSRQDAAMAFSGGLARANWSVEDIKQFIEAVVVAAGDDEVKMRVETADRTADKIDDGKKATGFPRLAELVGDEVVTLVRQWLGIEFGFARADIPLPVETPWPDPPAEEAYYGLAGRIVRAIEPATEADSAALLFQVLVAFGNVIGRSAHFTVEADDHYANEFAVLVGKTSKARKGTSTGWIHRFFEKVEEQWTADRIQSGLSSGQGLIWAVRDPITKREKVSHGKGEAPTYEDVEADAGVTDKRLMIYEPEFASVLKQTECTGNILSTVLRLAWDGRDLRTMTKNDPARATGAHVSLIGHITSDELRRYLTVTETANGFANRFLWICTQRSKLLPEGGRVDGTALTALQTELAEALAFARSVGGVTRNDEARAIWRDVYGQLSEGKPGLAGALLARAEAHVMRLAMLYAVMDRSAIIQAPHLLAAMALWDYAERSVYYLFGDSLGDPIADDLLRLLRGCSSGMTRTEMMHYFGRHQSSERIGRALGLLLQHHLVRREQQKTEGRPAERWFAATRSTTPKQGT